MGHKLSDGLATLSAKTKSVEDKIAKAKESNKEKLDTQIAEAKANAEKKKTEFISKADAEKAKIEGKVSSAKSSFKEKVAHLKAAAKAKKEQIEAKIAENKHEIKLTDAEWDYEDAVDYAENCVEWALIALADVEEAALEVLDAKLKYESLK
jgi:hypothetical protein